MTNLNTDISHMTTDAKRHRTSAVEYRFYLALIFVAVLPFRTVIWMFQTLRDAKLPAQGPIKAALSDARTITPCIFWA